MKWLWIPPDLMDKLSHPVRGAWIEIPPNYLQIRKYEASHPVRGAWIEILFFSRSWRLLTVAPREGCVD